MASVLMLLIFLSVALSVLAGYFVVSDLAQRDEALARRRIEELRKDEPDAPALFASLTELELGELVPPAKASSANVPFTAWVRKGWVRPFKSWIARSGLSLTPAQLFAASALLAVGLCLAGFVSQGLLLGLPGLVGGAVAPFAYVELKRRGRQERFLSQLPGAFELMARIIRSGQSVPQAFQAVADACENPVAAAFARCREQQNLGLSPEVACSELAEQTGLLEMRIFLVALLIQQQTGGNLSEVLERLATLVRDRGRIRRQIRTLTAEGRMQAGVLLVLPFVLFVVLRFVNRTYTDVLFEHVGLLAATGASMLVGALWIRRIINFDI